MLQIKADLRSRMTDLDIAEVARRTGIPASTLRYYEDKKVIRSIGRRGLKRLFDPGVLDRLSLVALARAGGFSLEEIAEMFGPDGRPKVDRARLAAKADEVDRQIRTLRALRDTLHHTAACPAEDHWACLTFRKMLQVARRSMARAKRRSGVRGSPPPSTPAADGPARRPR